MPETNDFPISGVSDDVLRDVVSGYPTIPLTEAGDADRFIREIRRLAEFRAQSNWPEENSGEIAVFVMVGRPRQYVSKVREVAGPILGVLDLCANVVPLFGKLFILNKDGSNGFSISLPVDENAILDWLRDNKLAESPVAILWRRTLRLAVRRAGLSDVVRYEDVRKTPPEANLEQLLGAIANFHERQLITPGDCDGVWETERAAQYVPGPQPERAIQYALRIALDSWFHGVVRAESEDLTSVGRIDIRLLTNDLGSRRLGYWAIIELKVVRSSRNAPKGKKAATVAYNDNIKTMKDGLMQIHSYKKDRKAEEGLLEVYDLRNDKTKNIAADSEVKKLRSQCDSSIQVNVRPLYGSDKDYRSSQFS